MGYTLSLSLCRPPPDRLDPLLHYLPGPPKYLSVAELPSYRQKGALSVQQWFLTSRITGELLEMQIRGLTPDALCQKFWVWAHKCV